MSTEKVFITNFQSLYANKYFIKTLKKYEKKLKRRKKNMNLKAKISKYAFFSENKTT